MRIKGFGRANTRGPNSKGQCTPMRLVDLLPGLKFWQLRLQDQTVKIKHNSSYHTVSYKQRGESGRHPSTAMYTITLAGVPHWRYRAPRGKARGPASLAYP